MDIITGELLPCPFCGSDELGLCQELASAEWFVRCYVCHVETVRTETKAETINVWNRRDLARLTAENAALRKNAERYQKLRKSRPVLLITGFFGNYCVNKTIDDVDAALDAIKEGS